MFVHVFFFFFTLFVLRPHLSQRSALGIPMLVHRSKNLLKVYYNGLTDISTALLSLIRQKHHHHINSNLHDLIQTSVCSLLPIKQLSRCSSQSNFNNPAKVIVDLKCNEDWNPISVCTSMFSIRASTCNVKQRPDSKTDMININSYISLGFHQSELHCILNSCNNLIC